MSDTGVYGGDYIPYSGWAAATYGCCPGCLTTDHYVHETDCYFYRSDKQQDGNHDQD